MNKFNDIQNYIQLKLNEEHFKNVKNKYIWLRLEEINKKYYLIHNLSNDSNVYKTIGLGSDNFINLSSFKKYIVDKLDDLYDIEEAKQIIRSNYDNTDNKRKI